MKKYVLSLMTFALTSLAGFANACEGGSFYLGTMEGMSFFNHRKGSSESNESVGYALNFFGGYRFCTGLRLEGELGYRHATRDLFVESSFSSYVIQRKTEVCTLMVNGLYELPINSIWTPYLGLGLGYSHAESRSYWSTFSKNSFAWQAIGGVSYPVGCCIDLGLEYRYQHFGPFADNQTVGLSLKRYF